MKSNHCRRIAAALLIILTFSLAFASPALALDLNPADYFQLTFDPVTFDKSAVAPGETFHAVLKGRAACTKDLPLTISEVNITSQVVARPDSGGADITLNNEYIINIKPLPKKAGESFDINQSIALRFPAGAAPGDYSVIGKLTRAEVTVKVLISYTQDVTGSFPQESAMGAIKCAVPSTATAAPATAPPAATVPQPTAPVTNTLSSSTPPESAYPQPPPEETNRLSLPVIILSVIVFALIIVVVVLVRRHR